MYQRSRSSLFGQVRPVLPSVNSDAAFDRPIKPRRERIERVRRHDITIAEKIGVGHASFHAGNRALYCEIFFLVPPSGEDL